MVNDGRVAPVVAGCRAGAVRGASAGSDVLWWSFVGVAEGGETPPRHRHQAAVRSLSSR